MAIRLRIHTPTQPNKNVLPSDFILSCSSASTIYELRRIIEDHYSSLFPHSPPLLSEAVKNDENYLLPDQLIVGDVLHNGDHVFVVIINRNLSSEDFARGMTQAIARWNNWNRHIAIAYEACQVDEIICSNGVETLCMLCASKSEQVVRQSLSVLCRLFEDAREPSNSLLLERQCESMVWVNTLARITKNEEVKRMCAFLLSSVLKFSNVKSVLEKAGVGQTLIHLTRSENIKTRSLSNKGISLLSKDRHLPSKASSTEMLLKAPKKNINNGTEYDSVEDAIQALEGPSPFEVKKYTLDFLLRSADNPLFTRFVIEHGERFFKILRSTTKFDNRLGKETAELLIALSSAKDTGRILFDNNCLLLVSKLHEESKDSETMEFFASALRSLCFNQVYKPPVSKLVGLLMESASTKIRWIVSEALSRLSKSDEANLFSKFTGQLLSEASSAYNIRDSKTTLYLAQTLCNIALKEMNKKKIIKFGGAKFFVGLLADSAVGQIGSDDGLALERVSAKALANLASSSRENRAIVLELVETRVPSINSFEDSIVEMYLEMLYNS